ncbi:MAG: long-chain-fatty-acid--CoA ligase [Candidatus Bathycorpusculaceae bacterium]
MTKTKSDQALDEYLKKPWTKWYAPDTPTDINLPEITIIDAIDEANKKWGDKVSIIFYGKKIKNKEIREASLKFATALHDLGIGKGDAVAIYLPNCPQFVIAYYGILRLGAIVTTVSPLYTPREIAYQLRDSGAKAIICLDLHYEKVEKALEEAPLKYVIITSISEYLPGRESLVARLRGKPLTEEVKKERELLYFQDLLEKYPPNPPNVKVSPDDVAALPYTGGTTGDPKGAVLTHRNIVAVQEQMRKMFPEIEDGKECGLAALPFYHIYGQSVIMLTGGFRGGTGVLFAKPELDEIVDAVQDYNVTLFYGVPTLYKYLVDHPKTKRINWKKIKYLYCGADTLHEATRKQWLRITNREIHEGYGLTETSAVSHTNPPGRNKPGSFGIPLPGTYAAIADPEKNEFLPPGEVGELVLSGPQIMREYLNKSEENAKCFFEARGIRWFRTGDIVRMDEEGYFYFVERKKDLIKYKGLSVYSHEIEEVLYKHPKIKEAAAIGVPDPEVGQRIKAIVVPHPDYRGKLTEEEVIKWCEERLAHYKVPKIVEFRGEVPKTDVGKVDHKRLREEIFKLAQ